MESQTGDLRTGGDTNAMSENLERMAERMEAAASLFERTVTQLEERESARTGEVQKMVATVEPRERTPEKTGSRRAANCRDARADGSAG
jgi:hypothetical protein